MSYILDALKKSDQQRQRGATPTLQTSQSIEAPRQARRAWVYPTLALTVAAIAFALGSLRPWRTDLMVVAASSAPAAGTSAPAPAAPPATLASPQTQPVPQSATPTPPSAAGDAAKIASVERPRAMPAQPSAQEQRAPAPAPASDAPVVRKDATPPSNAAAKEEKAPEDKVIALADLPASVRAELPPMTITVHAYTRAPKDRLVGVNDKLLREGDTLTPDLVLERITPDGMIFAYKGTRFHRGVR